MLRLSARCLQTHPSVLPKKRLGMNNPISYRVLVVDDYAPWRRSLCSILQRHPSLQVVGEAQHGFEAVQKATELNPHLVLLDIHLPDLDGIEVSNRIGQAVPGTKIVFVSQVKNLDIVRTAMSDGVMGFVWKIDSAAELLSAIEAVFRGEKFYSRGVRPKSL